MGFFGNPPLPTSVHNPGNDVVWLSGAADPVNGVAGTGVGVAGPGSKYTQTTTKTEYNQHGTINDVLWNPVISP